MVLAVLSLVVWLAWIRFAPARIEIPAISGPIPYLLVCRDRKEDKYGYYIGRRLARIDESEVIRLIDNGTGSFLSQGTSGPSVPVVLRGAWLFKWLATEKDEWEQNNLTELENCRKRDQRDKHSSKLLSTIPPPTCLISTRDEASADDRTRGFSLADREACGRTTG
jgi:hypothetical protein